MPALATGVSSALASEPAFETEHALFAAEASLRRHSRGRPCAHSAALQRVAAAYVGRRAGDRGDNLARAAQLLAKAAALPATRECERAARAGAAAARARVLLALAEGPGGPKLEAAPDYRKAVKTMTGPVKEKTEKDDGITPPPKAVLPPPTKKKDANGGKGVTYKRSVRAAAAMMAADVADAALQALGDAHAPCAPRSLVSVDRARALSLNDLPGAVACLESARDMRGKMDGNRRARAAGAFADVLLASELARGSVESASRGRAARLLSDASAIFDDLFGKQESDTADVDVPTEKVDNDDAVSESTTVTSASGSDSEPDADSDNETLTAADGHVCGLFFAPKLDPLEPFVGWDVMSVRCLVRTELVRLGPMEGESRRSCVIC